MANIESLIENLKIKGFKPLFFNTRQEAVDEILNIIPSTASVGIGGSMTISELNIGQLLKDKGCELFAHSLVAPEKANQMYQYAQHADWYLSSTNAITEHGDLVNIDGTANRISTLTFGPHKIMYILGVNKITKDLSSAIDRIRNYTAPKNAVRLHKDTPCATSGRCCNCNSKDCLCNATLITHHPTRLQDEVYIIIINEELGY